MTEMPMTKTDIHYCFEPILFLILNSRILILFRISDFDLSAVQDFRLRESAEASAEALGRRAFGFFICDSMI